MAAAGLPPPPPPPGNWICPKCKARMFAVPGSIGCPLECVIKHGWKHRVCGSCHVGEATRAAREGSVKGGVHSAKMSSLCMPGPAKCGHPDCSVSWTFYDFLKCGDEMVVNQVLAASLESAIAEMCDSVICPLCLAPSFTKESAACRDAVCQGCKASFCTECRQSAHTGTCAERDRAMKISTLPDKVFSVDLKVMNEYGLRRHRVDLPVPNGVAFTLAAVASEAVCCRLIRAAESAQFQSLEKLFPNDYRSNDRLLIKSHHIADFLFERVVEYFLLENSAHFHLGGGIWMPYRMNELLKIGRYRPTCLFKPHRDGPWCPTMDEMSLLTFVLYLNDAEEWSGNEFPFRGGETRFLADDESKKVYASVTPKRGTAVLFSQHLPHEGASILSGAKYILRTEVMFRRAKSVLDPTPAFLSACEDLKKIAEAYEASNNAIDTDKNKFLSEYLKAIEIQSKPLPQSEKLPLPDDVVLVILAYLSNEDLLVKFGRLNKTCYRLSRDNAHWRHRVQLHFPEIASVAWNSLPANIYSAIGVQNLSGNWLVRYRSEFEARHNAHANTFLVLDIGQAFVKLGLSGKVAVQGPPVPNSLGSWRKPAPIKATSIEVDRFPSFYTTREEQWYSHGSRMAATILEPVGEATIKRELMDVNIVSPVMHSLYAPTGFVTSQGRNFLQQMINTWLIHAPSKFVLSYIENQAIVVLPDDWTSKHQLDFLHDQMFENRMPLFAVASVAVAKAHGVSSCVVLHYGFAAHMLSVVQDNVVVRCQRITKLRPTQQHAERLAALIHRVLLDEKPSPRSELTADEERIVASLKTVTNVSGSQFLKHFNSLIEKRRAADVMVPETAREISAYQVAITGGRIEGQEQFVAMIRAALLKRDAKWKVLKTATPMSDTINGVRRMKIRDFSDGTPAFTYGTVLPLVPLPALDFSNVSGN